MLFPNGLSEWTVTSLLPETRKLLGDGRIAGLNSWQNIVAVKMPTTINPAFAAIILRNTNDWIDASLAQPTLISETILCRTPPNLGILKEFVSPAVLEALHAGDTTGALMALGLKASSKDTVVSAVTASLRGELLQAQKTLVFKRDMDYSSPSIKKEAIAKAEAKVERLQAQLTALESRLAAAAGGDLCPICYDRPQTTTLTPCCRQAFCLACICQCIASKPVCPFCRSSVTSPKTLIVLGDGEATDGLGVADPLEEPPLPTKGQALLGLLQAAKPADRFLVFSAHEASFKGLREQLALQGVRCEVLQGTAARVDRLRRQFRDGTVQVLCMNARHVGAGLNLEAATHVVLYHRMNVELERQVVGRAVRFERTGDLRVIHLVHDQETTFNGAAHSDVIVHA
jgi:hypothetical protein